MSNRVAIITGSAQGIGRACAERLAEAGMDIVIADLQEEAAKEAAKEIADQKDVQAIGCSVDISDKEAVKTMVDKTIETFGTIDVLVNNAGICGPKVDISEMTENDWDKIMDVNLQGTVNCIGAVLPVMRQTRAGRIINMASISGEQGVRNVSLSYGASKAAIINLTRSLAKQLGQDNINVNAVAPGFIATEMTKGNGNTADTVPLGRLGTPRDIAGAVAFLAGEDSSYVTGTVIDVNGGIY